MSKYIAEKDKRKCRRCRKSVDKKKTMFGYCPKCCTMLGAKLRKK